MRIFRKINRIWLRFQALFYRGPADLGVRPRPRNGYQSPTVTICYWLYAWIVRHITVPGRFFILCLGLIFPYAMVSMLMPIHLLAFAMLLLFVFDFAVGFLLRPRLKLRRFAPERVSASSIFRFDYLLTVTGRIPAYDVIVDSLPLPKAFRFIHGRARAHTLAPGEQLRLQAEVTSGRRGRYMLPAVRGDSSFPFYLWRWGCTCENPRQLIVYPRFKPLRELDLPLIRKYQPGGIAFSSTVGDSMEFLGCREFRDGDNPRHLHWRSWARIGEPVVKEFREEYLCRTALVVDTFRPPHRVRFLDKWLSQREDQVFEAGMSLSAAIADYLSRQDYIVDLFAAGASVYRFQSGRSLGLLENILDVLACLEPQRQDPLHELMPILESELPQLSGAVLVLLHWDTERLRLLQRLRGKNLQIRIMLVRSDIDKNKNADLLPEIQVFDCSEILAAAL